MGTLLTEDLEIEQAINYNYDLSWSHQPSMIKEKDGKKAEEREFRVDLVEMGGKNGKEEIEREEMKETVLGGDFNIKMFQDEESREVVEVKNAGNQEQHKKVIFKNEFMHVINDENESERRSEDIENEVNQDIKRDIEPMFAKKKGRNFRETMGNIYKNLEKTFDNLSIEESPRESLNESNKFFKKTEQIMAQSDIQNYLIEEAPKSRLVQTSHGELAPKNNHRKTKEHMQRLIYNQDTYRANLKMRSPDLMKHMGKAKQSGFFVKKRGLGKKEMMRENSVVHLDEEQTTIEKHKNKFSAAELIHSYTRSPKNFSQTQHISMAHKRLSPRIKSTRLLPNLPQNNKEKLTQSFYEFPINNHNNSMIVDRSYDWGYRVRPQMAYGANQMSYFPNEGRFYGRYAQNEQVYHQMNQKMGQYEHVYQQTRDARMSPGNMSSNHIEMMDVTKNYSKRVQPVLVEGRDQHFENQFVRLETHQMHSNNGHNGQFAGASQQFSGETLESLLADLFKKILVFSSKIDSLKSKIIKRNPDFSVLNIFQTFCDLKTRRITFQGIKEFFQTFGFDFPNHFLARITIYLSGYRIHRLIPGKSTFNSRSGR